LAKRELDSAAITRDVISVPSSPLSVLEGSISKRGTSFEKRDPASEPQDLALHKQNLAKAVLVLEGAPKLYVTGLVPQIKDFNRLVELSNRKTLTPGESTELEDLREKIPDPKSKRAELVQSIDFHRQTIAPGIDAARDLPHRKSALCSRNPWIEQQNPTRSSKLAEL